MKRELAYLALPYSGTPQEIHSRVVKMTQYDAQLMEAGMFSVSPCYKHLMRLNNVKVPGDWNYWGEYSESLLQRCDLMIVVCLEGWRESIGVDAEIELAKKFGIPIFYVAEVSEGVFTALMKTTLELERILFRKV